MEIVQKENNKRKNGDKIIMKKANFVPAELIEGDSLNRRFY